MSEISMPKLRWMCRRGMLELDVMLEKFLANGYEQLDAKQREVFVRLLELPDPVLYHWLIGSDDPDEADWLEVIQQIRAV